MLNLNPSVTFLLRSHLDRKVWCIYNDNGAIIIILVKGMKGEECGVQKFPRPQ